MQFIKSSFPIVLIVFVLCSCNSKSTQFLLEDYETKRSRTNVLIIPNDEFFEIEVEDQNYVDFTDDSKNDFMNLFGVVFQDHTTARVYGIDKDMPLDINLFTNHELVNQEDTVRILGPKSGETILYEEAPPEFILLLQEYYMQLSYTEAPPAAILQGNASSNLSMKIKSKYAIWDNRNHRMAGWGTADYSLPFIAQVNRNVYMQLIGGLSKNIIEHSPFYGRNLGY